MELRNYQIEAIEALPESGAVLERLATGLGKTVIFSHIPRRGKMLCLSHREELVRQPAKYFDCPVGYEQAQKRSNGEEVVLASVQSMLRRLKRFQRDEFDLIVTDEAHHAAAKTYREIYEYFRPRLHVGFTATPRRGDGARLDTVFDRIVFDRDLQWGIKNGWLCDIYCLRVDIGYDLSHVAKRLGDYAPGQLDKAMNIESQNKAIAAAYYKYAKGQTIIFATSVEHAENIAKEIPGAVTVTAKTRNRQDIIEKFTRREIPVLVNCMIFTEGTDIPLVETIMIARPTQNSSLYVQMVGRGLRLHPDKEKLTLIDCVGITGKSSLCTAATLVGIDLDAVPQYQKDRVQGDLFDLPDIVSQLSDCPSSWIRNVELVNLWAKGMNYDTHNVNYFKMPNGDMTVSLPNRHKIKIPAPDQLGNTIYQGTVMPMQRALDLNYRYLQSYQPHNKYIWDLGIAKKWGKKPASEKQLNIIKRKCKGFDIENLTMLQASQILNRVMYQ